MSLWNGMWHGLLNDIILRNIIYAECLKEIIIQLSEKCVIFWRQSISKSSRFFNVAGLTTMTIKQTAKDSLISHCRYKKQPFSHSHKDSTCFYHSGCMAALTSESRPLKKRCFGIGRSRFLLLYFLLQKMFAPLISPQVFVYLYLYLKPLETVGCVVKKSLFCGQTLRNCPSRNSTLFSSRWSTTVESTKAAQLLNKFPAYHWSVSAIENGWYY